MIEDYTGHARLRARPGGRDPAAAVEPGRRDAGRLPDRADPHLSQPGRAGEGAARAGRRELPRADAVPQDQRLPRGEPRATSSSSPGSTASSRSGRSCSPSTTATTSFKDHAYPVLKELGFTATLFVYTDWVGRGPRRAVVGRSARAGRRRLRHPGPHQDPRGPAPRPGRDGGPVRAPHAGGARAAAGALQSQPRPAAARSWPIPTGAGTKACCPR